MTRIRKLSTPPTRQDPATFASRGDAFLSDLLGWAADANTLADELNALKLANDASILSTLAQATAARDAALAAWGASMAPAEVLPAISKTIHSGAIVRAIRYDTANDSDGGAWRKRCQDKIWYNETIVSGKWLGQAANEAGARAIAGAATGDYYQNTTDGKFYSLNAPNGQTEIFRGNAREFPEQVGIFAESGRVVIYDLTQTGCPMWAVAGATSCTSVSIRDGLLCIGGAANLITFNFVSCIWNVYRSTGRQRYASTSFTAGIGTGLEINASLAIVSSTVNDVAIAVLPDAPTDIATGLPIPTIAVVTSGGVSVIKNDGTVVSQAFNGGSGEQCLSVAFQPDLTVACSTSFGHVKFADISTGAIARSIGYITGAAASTTIPKLLGQPQKIAASIAKLFISSPNGLNLMHQNIASHASNASKGMVAYITNAFNSGWQVGDIRGAWLADIVPEVLTASGELVTNGTFATDTSGWTGGNATLSTISGAMRVTAIANGGAYAYLGALATVPGKTYRVSGKLVTALAGKACYLNVGTAAGSANIAVINYGATAATSSIDFVATTTTTHISFNSSGATLAGEFYEVDDVSVKLADPDRSVKNTGLIVNGAITKSPVAVGSQLVAYSGFSASNYLEQPYNANLDFGTGDFYTLGWGSVSDLSGTFRFLERDTTSVTANRILAGVVAGSIRGYFGTTMVAGPTATTSTMFFLAMIRSAGVAYLYVNGVLVGSAPSTDNLTLANAVTRLGWSASGGSSSAPTLALWRIGAGAPSADQVAHIYNTEKMLFQPNAKCTIDGSSTAVTALAYDENEDALHVGTSWGRSKFRDLVRIESAATLVGSITSLSAGQGSHITGGTSAAKIYQPAYYLREELRRKEEARRALGRVPAFFDFDTIGFTATTTNGSNQLTSVAVTTGTPYVGMGITGAGIPAGTTITNINGATYTVSANATASASGVALAQNTFNVPKGFTTKAVYSAGTLKRLGSTKDYVINTDGFVEIVTFGVSPGNAAWVNIMATRSN